jgi:hypothetical protein
MEIEMSPAERLAASTPRTSPIIPIRITPEQLPPCDDTVTVEIKQKHPPILQPGGQKKPWTFCILWPEQHPQWSVEFAPGVHQVPRALALHWYMAANGVEIEGHPPAAERLAAHLARGR